ncbi:polysaccharide deacetylase family protein [Clostridium sp. KNHs214]|uniref:polysaccharide deacetylase family protein n=1 Tax=Clostridium sp. KNHs214 TaxID=1540257 RepID=UPI00054CD82C|nr:polysaccharide deacetylase family protein [Clostridium sp. KNHs214]
MIYIYIENQKFSNKIKYVFNNIFFNLGLKHKFVNKLEKIESQDVDIAIIYSQSEEYEKHIKNHRNFLNYIIVKDSMQLFNEDYYMHKCSLSNLDVQTYSFNNDIELVSLFSLDSKIFSNKIVENKTSIFTTNLDIISNAFFMLTRYEEVVSTNLQKDIHDRVIGRESIAYKNNFLHRPIVNEYIMFLWSIIDSFHLGYKKKNWWKNKKFATCLTHDVDKVFKYSKLKSEIKNCGRLLLIDKSISKAIKNLILFVNSKRDYKKDLFWNLDEVMNKELKRGFKSSFYFMSGGNSQVDNNYSVQDERIINLIQFVEDKGFEAGYHGSYNSYNNLEMMRCEKMSLDKLIKNMSYGCRQHYLRFNVPKTWMIQEKIGIKYDASLGYADCEGFRCGYCFPYKPYDLINDRVINIWEIPLIVMEGTIVGRQYSNLDKKEGLKRIKQLIETTEKYNGVFNLLWHNSSFDIMDKTWAEWIDAYDEVLDFLLSKDTFGTSGRKIIDLVNKF